MKTTLLAIYFSLLLVAAWFLYPANYSTGGGGWWVCLDYVGAGTLYGGQPFCAQGPVIYYVGFLLDRTIGLFGSTLPFVFIGVSSNIVVYILIRRLLIRQGIYNPLLYAPLFLLMVYRFMGEVPSTLATAFFISGFYLLYEYSGLAAAALGGALFTLAVFTKYTTVVPILLAVAYLCLVRDSLRFRKTGRKTLILYRPAPGKIRFAIIAVAMVAASAAVLTHVFPNIVAYTLSGHSEQVKADLSASLMSFWDRRSLTNVAAALMLLTLSVCALRGFFDKDTAIYPLSQLTLLVYGLLFIRVGNVQDTNIGTHYMLPAYPLLIGAFMAVWAKSRKAFALLVLAALIYPSIFGNPLVDAARAGFEAKRDQAVYQIQYGLHFIPPQKGYVLTEGPPGYGGIFREYGAPIDPEKVVVLNDDQRRVSYTDATWTPALRKQINLTSNYSSLSGNNSAEDELLRAEIKSGKYSLIMTGPPSWQIIAENLEKTTDYVQKNYCRVSVPNFAYMGNGRSNTNLYFLNKDDCRRVTAAFSQYYNANDDRFCSLGKDVDGVIRFVAAMNNVTITYSCSNKVGFIYGPEEKYKMQPWDLVIMAILSLPVYVLVQGVARLGEGGPGHPP